MELTHPLSKMFYRMLAWTPKSLRSASHTLSEVRKATTVIHEKAGLREATIFKMKAMELIGGVR